MNSLKWILVAIGGILGGVFVLALLVCLLENRQGRRTWEQVQRDAEAKGINLDWKACIPPPVPDNQNFFEAPKMQEWFRENLNPYSNSHTELWPLSTNREAATSITNNTQAENYLSWSDQFTRQFALIREALKRPYARISGDYSQPSQIPEPDFRAFESVSTALAARANCDLLLGKPEAALEELIFLNHFRQILDYPPSRKPTTLIIAMVETDIANSFVKTIVAGQQSHKWNDSQLAPLQLQLQQINLPQRLVDAIRTRIPWNCYLFATNVIPGLGREPLLQGWTLQNLVTLTRLDEQAISAADLSTDTVFPAKLDDFERQGKEIYRHHTSPGNFLAKIGLLHCEDTWQRITFIQTLINEAQIACALERYHITHDEYPETLDALVPQFIETIPHDIIGGQPLHYRPTKDGKFLLYSIGWNQKDDGGQASPKDENGSIVYTNGDWVLGN